MTEPIKLPPLPDPKFIKKGEIPSISVVEHNHLMVEYGQQCARVAIEADRQARGVHKLLDALQAMLEVHGVTQAYAEKRPEIPQSWVEVSDLARTAMLEAAPEPKEPK